MQQFNSKENPTVLNYQPGQEREGLIAPVGLSALILMLAWMVIGLGLVIGIVTFLLFSWLPGAPLMMAISVVLIVPGLLIRWFAIWASRCRK